ncbi:MAG TPA: response regulator [Thermoanaerobaculia bacterium]|nr:response regulator [Thermoanaerobaculia bacterium]
MPTVLIIDDDEPIRTLITALCARMGVTVDWAGDGELAMSKIRRQPYDAVLLDLMLPKQNGFEVLRDLRAFAPHMLQRTIIITAVSDATLRDFDGGGTLAMLRKPFDISDLCDVISACTGCELPRRTPGTSTSAYRVQA